jgi:hypothetical protein
MKFKLLQLTAALTITLTGPLSLAHEHEHKGGIQSKASKAVLAPFDIFHTKITTEGNIAIFHIAVSGKAGATKPTKNGKLAGSTVFSYVWPTSLDPAMKVFTARCYAWRMYSKSHRVIYHCLEKLISNR